MSTGVAALWQKPVTVSHLLSSNVVAIARGQDKKILRSQGHSECIVQAVCKVVLKERRTVGWRISQVSTLEGIARNSQQSGGILQSVRVGDDRVLLQSQMLPSHRGST